MTISVTTMIVFTALFMGIGLATGFVLAVTTRLFFRYSFTQYCRQQMEESNRIIQAQIDTSAARCQQMVSEANMNVAHIYRAAAEHSAQAGITPPKPGAGMN
jgi:hypothetical protein